MRKIIGWLLAASAISFQGCSVYTHVNSNTDSQVEVKNNADANSPSLSKERLALIKPMMLRYIDEKNISGGLTLVAHNGNVEHFEAVGKMHLSADKIMQKDAIFRIYSMTKPITSVAVLQLFEDGHFALDDPISKFIPAFEHTKVYKSMVGEVLIEEPLTQPITIRHLLTHTSGLSYGFTSHPVDKLYQQATVFSSNSTLQQMVEHVASLPLIAQPGEKFVYSVANDVLGYLVEVVSGLSFENYLAQHIFQPLNMVDTGFYIPLEKQSRLAEIYTPNPNTSGLITLNNIPLQLDKYRFFPSGGGGLFSTAEDYLRFAQMLLNGGQLNGKRILGRKTVELLSMNHLPNGGTLPWDENVGYGLGVAVTLNEAGDANLSSVGSYGWSGVAGTTFWIDPQEKLIAILMTQIFNGKTDFHREFKILTNSSIIY